jgi:hypothetical protein
MKEIQFSRHAKRRAKLYNISESLVSEILASMRLREGEHEIIRIVPGFRYPLKIIVSVESDIATVITNYPLKRGMKK